MDCNSLNVSYKAAQQAIVDQQKILAAKTALKQAQMALYMAAAQDESKENDILQKKLQDLNNIQMMMMFMNCPIQPGQA